MGDQSATPDYELTIGGATFNSTATKKDVIEIVVDNASDGPDMCSIRLTAYEDGDLGAFIDDAKLKIGGQISVKVGFYNPGGGGKKVNEVFKGEITGWEPVVQGKEPSGIVVRGYNKVHRLSRGRRSRPFLDMTLKDIVGQIAGEYGLSPDAGDVGEVGKPYTYQPNMTDLDFLRMLASRVGFEVRSDLQEKLVFKAPDVSGDGTKVEWGKSLKKFKPRVSSGNQVSKIKVSGYDVKQKARIEASASASDITSMGAAKKGAEQAAQFEASNHEYHITLPQPYALEDLERMAKGIMNKMALQYVTAEMECEGESKIMAGTCIDVQGVKERFKGKYYVVRSRNIVRQNQKMPDAGYVTEVIGRKVDAGE